MKKALLVLLVFIAFLLESRTSVFGVSPNLTAAIVYYYGIRQGEAKGILFGSVIGLIGDSLSGGIIGPNILGKGLVGFFSSFMSGSFFRWTPLLGMIGISVLTALDGAVVFLARTFFEQMPTSASKAAAIILISAVINSFPGLCMRPQNE